MNHPRSLFAFYIPMVIMVVTYVLTVHHLKKQKLSTALNGARHQVSGVNKSSLDISAGQSSRHHLKD